MAKWDWQVLYLIPIVCQQLKEWFMLIVLCCICINWCWLSVQAQVDKLQATPPEHSLSTVPDKPLYLRKDPRILAVLSHQWETTGQQGAAKARRKSVSS